MTKRTILSINPGHNGSAALVVDGQLAYYAEEERISKLKYDGNPFRAMLQILQITQVDELVIGGTTTEFPNIIWTNEDPYSALARKFNPNIKITKMGDLITAAQAGFAPPRRPTGSTAAPVAGYPASGPARNTAQPVRLSGSAHGRSCETGLRAWLHSDSSGCGILPPLSTSNRASTRPCTWRMADTS